MVTMVTIEITVHFLKQASGVCTKTNDFILCFKSGFYKKFYCNVFTLKKMEEKASPSDTVDSF